MVLAWFTAAAGAMGVIDSILPEHSRTFVSALAPGARPLASALVAPVGLALVYVARGLARGSRRSWQLALALLIGATILHLAHSDYGALVTGALAAALLARRGDFRVTGDPSFRSRLLVRLALVAGAICAYGLTALWANRLAADRPYSVGFALHETVAALAGSTLRGSDHLSGPFGSWFGPSVFALGLAGAAALAVAWLAPWRWRHDDDERLRLRAHEIVAAWGSDTLAPFVLRADKSYFFGPGSAARSSPTAWWAVWRSSPEIRSGRRRTSMRSSRTSSTTSARTAGGSRFSVSRRPVSRSTAGTACGLCTTATRQ